MSEEVKGTGVQVSWSEETDKEPGRDFIGTVVKSEYPFTDPNSQFAETAGPQLRLLVRAEEPAYENLQPIWLPPSNSKGSKFVVWRNHLIKECAPAWREVLPKVQDKKNPEEQIASFGESLVGMKFQFKDHTHPRANNPKETVRLLCPVKYIGKGQVAEIKEQKIQL